jgi:disulfide bond formation protein DsbB
MTRHLFAPSLAAAGVILAIASLAALAGAWAFEFAGYKPCPLCLEQRIPYYIAVPGGLLAAMLASRAPRAAAAVLGLCAAAFLYNAGLGVYHAGAEWKFWPGPQTCAAAQQLSQTPGDLVRSLQNSQVIRCDEAALRILGLSLAGYSAAISLALAAISAITLSRFLRKGGRRPELSMARR